MLLYH